MTDYQRRAGLLNRVVLAHVHGWLEQHTQNKDGELPDLCYKLKAAGYASRVINSFDDKEAIKMDKISKDEEFIPIRDKEISLAIMALEVMKNHVMIMLPEDRTPKVNISDKKLLIGKNVYLTHMLTVKKNNPEVYERQKPVIDDTVEHASAWYSFMKDAIMSDRFDK